MTMMRKRTKLIRDGKFAADVSVELIEDDTAWSPYLSLDDVRKLDAVRLALWRGDIVEARNGLRADAGECVASVARMSEATSGIRPRRCTRMSRSPMRVTGSLRSQ
jgi:hypothetical protein